MQAKTNKKGYEKVTGYNQQIGLVTNNKNSEEKSCF